ncbi:hypothetical protein PXY30_004456 [Salmonella enterica]|nr:hypothetical protein [Salmonella enterica]
MKSVIREPVLILVFLSYKALEVVLFLGMLYGLFLAYYIYREGMILDITEALLTLNREYLDAEIITLLLGMVFVLGFGSRAVFVQCNQYRMCKRLLDFQKELRKDV